MKFISILSPLILAATVLATPVERAASQGQPIHFNHMANKCLSVQNSVIANGTPVQM
jgi:hypothetical protein